jgi:hypothetical protein
LTPAAGQRAGVFAREDYFFFFLPPFFFLGFGGDFFFLFLPMAILPPCSLG